MKEEALKVGCVRAEISSHLDSSSSNVQSGCGPCVLVPSGMAGLLLGYALASSLGSRFFPRTRRLSCILLGTLWNSWQQPAQLGAPRNTTFDIGIDISLLHCVWDSLTHNKDNTEGVVFSLSSKKKKKSPWMGHRSCNWFPLLAQDSMLCSTLRLTRKGTDLRIWGWEGSSLSLPQLLKHYI